jgi:hypothetical protein
MRRAYLVYETSCESQRLLWRSLLADVCICGEVREACERSLAKDGRRRYVAKNEVLERAVQVEYV